MKKVFAIISVFVLTLAMVLVPAVASASDGSVTLSGMSYEKGLNLDNKADFTPDGWDLTPEDVYGATLGYNSSGTTFDWGLEATVPTDGDYALIYYADASGDRFGEWGGDNPGAVIAILAATGGAISTSGSTELNMDLPCPPDANQFEHDYSGAPDFYDNAHGAKIWLIPTSALTSGNVLPVVAWPPTDGWLFETDLITYDDDDVESNIIAITVLPDSVNFGIIVPGEIADGGDVTVQNTGTVPAVVGASVTGTSVFNYLELNELPIASYDETLSVSGEDIVPVRLNVPSGYAPIGAETGTLTFTASATP